MKNLRRSLRALALVALFIMAISLSAQEATEEPASVEEPEGASVTVTGSGIVNPVVEELVSTSGSSLDYSFTTTGTAAGFEAFCAGEADITSAIRPINVEEDTLCRDGGVEFLELLVGYEVLAVVANPEDDFLTCLTADNLDVIFAPSSTVTNWEELGFESPQTEPVNAEAEATEEPVVYPDVTVLLPEDGTLLFESLDGLVTGFGFRANAESADTATVIETVSNNPGAIGVTSLNAAQGAGDTVSVVNLNLAGTGCAAPDALAIENERYIAATPFYLYVATASQETLAFLLDYIASRDVVQGLADAGYTSVSPEAILLNAAIVRGEVSARAATAEEITYTIPPGLNGNINIVGAASGYNIANSVSTSLSQTQQQLAIEVNTLGQTLGEEDFCAGEADILFVEGAVDGLCEGNVAFEQFDLGTQAAVIVSNPDDSFTACLTLEQVNTIWGATASEPVTQWSGVSDAFPEQDLILVGVNSGNALTDVLMTSLSDGVPLPVRVDVAETNRDPVYRATAVGLVSGALTYMSWADYQNIAAQGDSNIQLVAINTGDGCVVPNEETILDGSYPITRSISMVVSQDSLSTDAVQSYVWTVFADANAGLIRSLDLIGGFQALDTAEFRSTLLSAFESAEQAQLVAEPEATEETTDD